MQYIRKATLSDANRLAEIEVFCYRLNFYPIFRNDDFDEGIVAAELKRLNLRRFTRKLQLMLHDMYAMPVGYNIF